MVKVREDHPLADDGKVDIHAWLDRLPGSESLPQETRDELYRACQTSSAADHSDVHVAHGWGADTSSFRIGLEMAEILAELQLDQDTLVAAVLYRAVREQKLALETVRMAFGDTVAKLITGVLRMAAIS